MSLTNIEERALYKQYGENIHFEQWDIVLVDFGENVGNEKNGVRPAVIVSKEVLNRAPGNVIVAPLTKAENKKDDSGQVRLYRSQVFLSGRYFRGLQCHSIVQTEDIRAIDRNRLIKYMDSLSLRKIDEVREAMKFIMG